MCTPFTRKGGFMAKEVTASEKLRVIYQVNKRLYRLQKSGIAATSSAYENALAVIQRGEKKQNKQRLTVTKNPQRLQEQYMKALEIIGSGEYEDLSKAEIKRKIQEQQREERRRRDREGELWGDSDIKRRDTFDERYGITDVDYAMYNFFKSSEWKRLKEALGSDTAIRTIAPAANVGLSTGQLRKMTNEYLASSANDDKYYQNKFADVVEKWENKYK